MLKHTASRPPHVRSPLGRNRHIREVMKAEVQKQGLKIDKSRLAELQPLAGRNSMLAVADNG